MSSFAVKLQCPNPECLYSENRLGQPACDRCQNPLTYRYVWVLGTGFAQTTPDALIDCRYAVIDSQIWLDTQPGLPPKLPSLPPEQALPYLHLYPQRLHLPELFSIYQPDDHQPPIYLLTNAPINAAGRLQPLLEVAWTEATAVRQLNWLWQILQLWQPLKAQGVATSLLVSENLHVEGWRVRLRELIADGVTLENTSYAQTTSHVPVLAFAGSASEKYSSSTQAAVWTTPQSSLPAPLTASRFGAQTPLPPSLRDLGEIWRVWVEDADQTIQAELHQLCDMLQSTPETPAGMRQITDFLNHQLLQKAAELPLKLDIAGGTTTGTQRTHNEDACYPSERMEQAGIESMDALLPHVSIICDGIGGHEGGEVASQLALRSLQLQLRTWLAELAQQVEPLSPTIIEEQLSGVVRVVNNLIAAQNDLQGRAQRQRMATTLVMAVQPPQLIETAKAAGNSHELYLVHVGDSRAYWLTPEYCQRLTVDDDVTTREVRSGRSFYGPAAERSDATALTQALGTRESNLLKITVQRFILEEDGVLLLCSDGISDSGLVEQFWQSMTQPILEKRLTLKTAVQEWLNLANRLNGQDNASIVLLHCQLSDKIRWFNPKPQAAIALVEPPAQTEAESEIALIEPPDDLTESAKALLYDDDDAEAEAETESTPPPKAAVLPKRDKSPQKTADSWLLGLGVAAAMFVLGALGVAIWRELAPVGFRPNPAIPTAPQPEE